MQPVSNISWFVRHTATRRPDGAAIRDGSTTMTWAQLDAAVDGVACALQSRGLANGERVGLVLGNSWQFVVSLYGALRAGACVVPMNPGYTAAELAVLMADSGVRLVVCNERTQVSCEQACGAVGAVELVSIDAPLWERWVVGTGDLPSVQVSPLALLLFTAGTSGRPKGAMLTHASLVANTQSLCALQSPAAVTGEDVVLAVLPMFHIYGLNTVLNLSASVGATLVILDRFDAVESARIIAETEVSVVPGAPAMFAGWSGVHQMRQAMAGVRLWSSGGAPLPPAVGAAFTASTGLEIFQGYGMTECAPVVTTTLVSGHPVTGSVGQAIPGVSVRIVDGDGDDADDDDPGEVWIKGECVFSGYWPDGAGGPDADGWFHSGDIAYRDQSGNIYLVDRRRDMVLINGFNVYPREIELVIESMPQVAEVAVLGVPDDITGEAVLALVVPRPGNVLTAELVSDFCSDKLARFKWPGVRIVDVLPHVVGGKVAKGRLREVYQDIP